MCHVTGSYERGSCDLKVYFFTDPVISYLTSIAFSNLGPVSGFFYNFAGTGLLKQGNL